MKKVITSLAVFIIVLTISVPVDAQQEIRYQDVETFSKKSFYFLLGYTQGPYFDDYVDWINQYYRDNFSSNDIMKDFDGGFSFSAGFRNRFTRYFAFDFDFAFHSMRIKKTYYGTQVGFQDLQMNVAIFTGSVPIILEFYDNQLLVPFIAAGISIFSLRLDHTINWGERHIKTAIAGNFSVGCEIKLTQKLYADLRADWMLGKVKMPVTQIVGQPDNFNLSLSTTQLQIGILYGFR